MNRKVRADSASEVTSPAMKVRSRLAELRNARGLSASELASVVSVTRQAIYAIESGDYAPNTAIALKLAQTLGVSVEEIFQLDAQPAAPHCEDAEMLDRSEAALPGKPVCLARVDGRLIATIAEPSAWSLPRADGTIAAVSASSLRTSKSAVKLFSPTQDFNNSLLMAGCDPGISILGRHLEQQGVQLVVAHRNSTKALDLLHQGKIHVAGCHIRDHKTDESNLAAIGSIFRKQDIAVVSLAVWEEGLIVAANNPKTIRSIADLARADVTIVNREHGAGSRLLLDAQLRMHGILSRHVKGYKNTASGHLAAARHVQSGKADCCLAVASVARVLGLGFVPLVSERYDLVVHRRHLQLPQIEALFNTLALATYQRELRFLGGYDTSVAGQRLI